MCPTGEFDESSFIKFFSELRESANSKKFYKLLFNFLDVDKSKTVDFNEFLIAVSLTGQIEPKEKLRFAFKMFDTDGNKQLDICEVETIVSCIYDLMNEKNRIGSNHPGEVAKYLLAKMDLNKNGYLEEDEFINSILTYPTLNTLKEFLIKSYTDWPSFKSGM
jgi:neuronal calcium sensor 1